MGRVLGTVFAAGVAVAALAAEAGPPVVVELFTSQGCSSCPPADALLSELAAQENVIALALHVDYWDYIGWKDSLARPEHTERQKGYAAAAGKRMIYTPQFVIGGTDHITGVEPMEMAAAIERHRDATQPVDLAATRAGEEIRIEARAVGAVGGPVVVQVVRYVPVERVAITRGENAGRTFDYHNAVNLWIEVGRWSGTGTYRATTRVAGEDPVVVILQRAPHGAVLAAARAR